MVIFFSWPAPISKSHAFATATPLNYDHFTISCLTRKNYISPSSCPRRSKDRFFLYSFASCLLIIIIKAQQRYDHFLGMAAFVLLEVIKHSKQGRGLHGLKRGNIQHYVKAGRSAAFMIMVVRKWEDDLPEEEEGKGRRKRMH